MGEISTCIKVGIKIGQTAMGTRKTTFGTRTKLSASVADLGSVVRLSSFNSNPFSFSFVLDETLQLIETPVANPIVHLLSSVLFPDAPEAFHHNLVSVEIGNYVFADVVVYPGHITSFPTAKLLEQSLSRPCAFGLEFTAQIFELPLGLLDFCRIIKPVVGSNSEVVYSEVNAQNMVLRTNVLLSGSNLFRECEQEETSAFFVHSEKTFGNFPVEVFGITGRDVQVELLSAFEKPQNKSVSFDIGASWKVVSDACPPDDWFGFSPFDHSTSLSYASNSYLRGKFEPFSDSLIDSIMEFEVFGDFMLPSIINTELQSFSISFDSSDYLISWIDSNLCSDIRSHNIYKIVGIFNCFGGEACQFLPHMNQWVSSTQSS